MRTLLQFYKTESIGSFNPRIEITPADVMAQSSNVAAQKWAASEIEYLNFRMGQKTAGQRRKNQRSRARRRIFKNCTLADLTAYNEELKRMKEKALAKLPVYTVEIRYDGRQKNNLSLFKQAVELDLNVGGISAEYYDHGFRGYKVISDKK